MLAILIVILTIIIVLIFIGSLSSDKRCDYTSVEHMRWCEMLGVYADGTPKGKTSVAISDIQSGPDSRVLLSSLSKGGQFTARGASGKEYRLDPSSKKRYIIKEIDNEESH